jgi:hypothetical protein
MTAAKPFRMITCSPAWTSLLSATARTALDHKSWYSCMKALIQDSQCEMCVILMYSYLAWSGTAPFSKNQSVDSMQSCLNACFVILLQLLQFQFQSIKITCERGNYFIEWRECNLKKVCMLMLIGASNSGVNHLIFNSDVGVRKVQVHIINHCIESMKGKHIHKE